MTKNVKYTINANYAIEGSVGCSTGPCYSTVWDDTFTALDAVERRKNALTTPLLAQQKQISFVSAAVTEKKRKEENVEKINGSNVEHVERVYIPHGHDTMVMDYNLTISGLNAKSTKYKVDTVSNRKRFEHIVTECIKTYPQALVDLSEAYAYNLLTGSAINYHGRNLLKGANRLVDVRVVSYLNGDYQRKTFTANFDQGVVSNNYDQTIENMTEDHKTSISDLASIIANHLKSTRDVDRLVVHVTVYLQMTENSQVHVTTQCNPNSTEKKFYRIAGSKRDHVGMSSDSIGHCFRTVDKWYDGFSGFLVPLESSGQNKTNGIVRRNLRSDDKRPQEIKPIVENYFETGTIHEGDAAYFLGMLVRGFVSTIEKK